MSNVTSNEATYTNIDINMTIINRIAAFCVIASFATHIHAQTTSKINWIGFEEAMRLNATEQKPIIVDMYTTWCGFCRKLDAETFSDPRIIQFINEHYYAVKFDAETTDSIKYKDSVYYNMRIGAFNEDGSPAKGKSHSLAEILLSGRMAYPTLVYMIPDKDIVAPVPGYVTPEKIEPYLLFFSEKIYEGNLFDAFSKGLKTEPIINKKQ